MIEHGYNDVKVSGELDEVTKLAGCKFLEKPNLLSIAIFDNGTIARYPYYHDEHLGHPEDNRQALWFVRPPQVYQGDSCEGNTKNWGHTHNSDNHFGLPNSDATVVSEVETDYGKVAIHYHDPKGKGKQK